MLSRESILNANDCPLIAVPVPEWGDGEVYVQALSVADMEAIAKKHGKDQSSGMTAVQIIRDADGNRVFTDDDAPQLEKKSGKVILRIIGAFNDANGLTEAKVEDAVKNS